MIAEECAQTQFSILRGGHLPAIKSNWIHTAVRSMPFTAAHWWMATHGCPSLWKQKAACDFEGITVTHL